MKKIALYIVVLLTISTQLKSQVSWLFEYDPVNIGFTNFKGYDGLGYSSSHFLHAKSGRIGIGNEEGIFTAGLSVSHFSSNSSGEGSPFFVAPGIYNSSNHGYALWYESFKYGAFMRLGTPMCDDDSPFKFNVNIEGGLANNKYGVFDFDGENSLDVENATYEKFKTSFYVKPSIYLGYGVAIDSDAYLAFKILEFGYNFNNVELDTPSQYPIAENMNYWFMRSGIALYVSSY